MIQLQNVAKQYGSKVLLENASAFIGPRSRVALIGPNGSGKSTLFKIILGQEEPDAGTIAKTRHIAIGHLAQEMPKLSDRAVLSEVMRLDGRRENLLQAKAELEQLFSATADAETISQADLNRYGRIQEELEHLDEYRLESRAKEILMGMGFTPADFNRSLSEFSGGWLMRIALSRILLMDPDLLLLDEPTNHLDLESLLWLESFLGSYHGAILVVSHDTEFLNRIVDEVLEIDQQRLWSYKGNIESYARQKEERLTLLRAQYEGQQAKIAEMEAFISRFRAKASKAKQAQSRIKQLEKMERIELPEDRAHVRFKFPPAPHGGREVVSLKHACVGYPGKTVFRDLDWTIRRGARLIIVGANGVGKTTLLKLLAGKLEPLSGTLTYGHAASIGYYAQHQAEALDLRKTVLEELYAAAPPDVSLAQVRSIAGAFLFSGDAADKKCSVLSGGEKARVALAKLLLSPSNFLLLDEPTNHLDVESRGILLEALQDYEGTLCLVSHDRAFVAPLVDTILEIEPPTGDEGSRVVQFLGDYDDYLAKKTREATTAVDRGLKAALPKEPKAQEVKVRTGPSHNQIRSWERKRDQLEAEVTKIETRLAALQQTLADNATYEDRAKWTQLADEQRNLEATLAEKLAQWEEVCSLLG